MIWERSVKTLFGFFNQTAYRIQNGDFSLDFKPQINTLKKDTGE